MGTSPVTGHLEWASTGEVTEWRGPAPYLFAAMTPQDSEDLKEAARGLIYRGQVPVHVTIGGTRFTTALFPRDGRYLVPVKAAEPTDAVSTYPMTADMKLPTRASAVPQLFIHDTIVRSRSCL